MNQLYICDPELNTACSKQHCGYNPLVVDQKCFYTKHTVFAKKPIEKVVLSIPIDATDAVLFDLHVANAESEAVEAIKALAGEKLRVIQDE